MSWPTMTLAEALESAELFTDGDWVESKDQNPAGDVRLVQMADIGVGSYLDRSNRYLTTETARRLNCTFLERGDLLISRMPDPLGRCCVFPGDEKRCVTVVDVCVVRPDLRLIEPRWLMHCLNSPMLKDRMNRFTTGTTRARISRSNLGRVHIQLPPLDRQRHIAQMLDHADTMRAKRRQALTRLDELVQSTFLDMFGAPATWPGRWEMATIGDIADDVQYGTAAKAGSEGLWPIIRMGNLTDQGRLDLNDLKWIDLSESDIPKFTVRRGDLLFNRTNSREKVGKTCVVDTDQPLAFAGYLVRVRFKPQHQPQYVNAYMTSRYGRAMRYGMAKAAINQANINATEMRSIPIALPPKELQTRFAQVVSKVNVQREHHLRAAAELDRLTSSLQSCAFSGQL